MVMATELVKASQGRILGTANGFILPAVIADLGDKAAERFFILFTDTILNANTRAAYYRNTMRFFAWTHRRGLALRAIKSYHVSAYLAELTLTGKQQPASTPTVKQHLVSLTQTAKWQPEGRSSNGLSRMSIGFWKKTQRGKYATAYPAPLPIWLPPSFRRWLKNVALHPPPCSTNALTRSAVLP